jgi:hypothetical protein
VLLRSKNLTIRDAMTVYTSKKHVLVNKSLMTIQGQKSKKKQRYQTSNNFGEMRMKRCCFCVIEECWVDLAYNPNCILNHLLAIYDNSRWPPNSVLWCNFFFCFKGRIQVNVNTLTLLHLYVKTVLCSHLNYLLFFFLTNSALVAKIGKTKDTVKLL